MPIVLDGLIAHSDRVQLPFNLQNISVTGNLVGNSVGCVDKTTNEILFDLSLLEEMDDDEYISDILTIFLGNTPKELNELKNACISNKFEVASEIAHKLKGSAGLLQANFLINVLTEIEESTKATGNVELANLAELANREYKKIETLLKPYLRNIGNK